MERTMNDFIIAGVGGQGGLLVTTILASAFIRKGYDVKTSEIHGMAQRGGSVTSYVRRGEKVYGPAVPKGKAHVILGLELLEAYRELPNLEKGGMVITSDERIYPIPVIMGDASYPNLSREDFLQRAKEVYIIPALDLAKKAKNVRTSNIVCLGALSNFLDLPVSLWEEEIASSVPKKTVEANLLAFHLGKRWIEDNTRH